MEKAGCFTATPQLALIVSERKVSLRRDGPPKMLYLALKRGEKLEVRP